MDEEERGRDKNVYYTACNPYLLLLSIKLHRIIMITWN